MKTVLHPVPLAVGVLSAACALPAFDLCLGPVFLVWLCCVVIAGAGRYPWQRHLVAVCPLLVAPLVAVALAVVQYATGTAALRGHGLPGAEFFNLDPVLRCRRVSLGCVIDPSCFLVEVPYNETLRGLGAVCGPMPGGWNGTYPSRREAFDGIATAPAVARRDDLAVAARRLGMQAPTDRARWIFAEDDLRVARVGDCLLVGSPQAMRVQLYDDQGRPFAVYVRP